MYCTQNGRFLLKTRRQDVKDDLAALREQVQLRLLEIVHGYRAVELCRKFAPLIMES